MNRTLFNWALLMTEQEHQAGVVVLQEPGYIVYLNIMRQFSNDKFRKALWLRLGIPFTAIPHHCSCRSQSVIDEHVC